jgi:hypothetical protein
MAQQESAATRPILSAPLDVTMPKPPAPFKADGKTHLVYELHVTNLGADACLLDRVSAIDAGANGRELAAYDGQPLIDAVARPGAISLRGVRKLTIGAGERAVIYVWLSVDENQTLPRALQHSISVKVGEAQRALTTGAARVELLPAPKIIASPLKGADWLAANGPSNSSGHRRTMIAVDATARIPQRFAIDWLRLRPDGSRYVGDATLNRNYLAYGQEALAVADGIVSAVKDGIPENVPGPSSRAVPITMETIGGNYVILNIGGGAYAFYAHLQPGSITVKVGDHVRQGQVVGLVGNSGNSTEPHLHFHLSDANSPLGGEGIPYAFRSFELEGRIASLQSISWTPLATPEPRQRELPLENVVVRFPGEDKR